jgi:hypothetical protein
MIQLPMDLEAIDAARPGLAVRDVTVDRGEGQGGVIVAELLAEPPRRRTAVLQ